MQIYYSPQRSDNSILYTFDGEVITCDYEGRVDTFDFSLIPEGVMDEVETTLSINPIVSAKRESGVLFVELLNFHAKAASQSELFPEWQVIE